MTPAANNPTPSKPRRWLRPVATVAAVIALSAATGWGVASLASPAQAPDTAKVRAALKLRLPKTPIDAITCDGLGGLCEVASKSTLFYVDRAAKYLVIGRIYDMDARQDLTAARLLALNPDLLAAGAARRTNAGEESQPSPRATPQKVSLAGLPKRAGAGLVIAADLAAAERALGTAGVRSGNAICVPPAAANGTLLAFVAA